MRARHGVWLGFLLAFLPSFLYAQEPANPTTPFWEPKPDWHYGAFLDLGYLLDFNFPQNHLFRNKGTTPRVNELDLNMGAVYVRKDATEQSRWGLELEP